MNTFSRCLSFAAVRHEDSHENNPFKGKITVLLSWSHFVSFLHAQNHIRLRFLCLLFTLVWLLRSIHFSSSLNMIWQNVINFIDFCVFFLQRQSRCFIIVSCEILHNNRFSLISFSYGRVHTFIYFVSLLFVVSRRKISFHNRIKIFTNVFLHSTRYNF